MRWAKRIGLLILVLLVAVGLFGVYTIRRSFPRTNGEIEIPGLQANVEVLRDRLGVPHIYASNQHDLFFAQGYSHAQDRFYQMDFWRHLGAGRLSEMFGATQVDTDEFLRSLGWEATAREEWDALADPFRSILMAYADGVNAYLDGHSGADVSVEYAILALQNSDYEIEPWSPVNTLTWGKVMSWDLSSNMSSEIARAALGRDLSPDQVSRLFPPFPEDKPVILEDEEQPVASQRTMDVPDAAVDDLVAVGTAAENLWSLTGGGFEGIGSNNWAVSGELTESGLPLLANDTHLANQIPSIWYENGLHCASEAADCPFQVVGFSFPGTPGVIVGHNAHHAWGVTTEDADTQDLFIERLNPADSGQYEVDGDWIDFETRTETIRVAGGDDVTFEAMSSRHGPVISETFLDDDPFDGSFTVEVPDEYVVALAWKSLEPSTLVEAIIGIDAATSYQEFRDATALWDIAAQNLVYADVEGNIAYQSTGAIPVRASGDGQYPVPGWTSEYDWIGTVPFEEMPSLFNPGRGFIESANQPILRAGSLPYIGSDGAYGYRASRIEELIRSGNGHTLASMQAMQFDTRDGGAELIVPFLLQLDPESDQKMADTQRRINEWSTGSEAFQVAGDSSGAALYEAVWRQILAATFHDDLPEDYWPTGGSRWFEVIRNMLDDPHDPFWDVKSTAEVETRDDILREAMAEARRELSTLLGSDADGWSWGGLHIAHFQNQSLGKSGIAPLEWLLNRTAPPRVRGSSSLVNAVGWNPAESYEVDWVPSERMVVDLSDLDASTFIHTTGQSGHAFAENYASMIEMWTDGEQAPMPFSRNAVEEASTDVLHMVPG